MDIRLPYKSPKSTPARGQQPERSGNEDSRRLSSSICRRLGILAIIASVIAIAWMFVGGLVTYGPGPTANEMQSIYLSRMFWYGTTSVILQLVALGFFVRASRDT